jgi:hypothetical protein
MVADHRFKRCLVRVPVLIQKRTGGGWRTALRIRTHDTNDKGVAQFIGVLPRGWGAGTYRAVAPRRRFRNQTCARASRVG